MSEYGKKIDESSVRLERLLPGPIEKVWAYLTEPEKRRTWFAGGPMELRPGGRVELQFHNSQLDPKGEKPPEKFRGCDEVVSSGRILECEPPRLLAFLWEEDNFGPTEVTFELSPQGDQVKLVLTHRKLASRKGLISVASGWHAHVGILEDQLRDRPLHRPFWSTVERLEEEYERLL